MRLYAAHAVIKQAVYRKFAKLAFEDLDECMYEILKDTLEYLEEDSADDIEPTSKEAYIYYKECIISVITYLIINTPAYTGEYFYYLQLTFYEMRDISHERRPGTT